MYPQRHAVHASGDRASRRPVALAVAIVVAAVALIATGVPGASAVARAPQFSAIPSAKKSEGKSMAKLIKNAKKTKKKRKAFKKRLAKLKKSPALVQIVKSAHSRRYALYMEYFAAITSAKKVDKLVKKTKGKHFEISGKSSRPKVLLVSNVDTRSFGVEVNDSLPAEITCWQGWVAFWAWWVGSEMTCVAFGAAVGAGMAPTGLMAVGGGVIAGSACSGLMAYLQQQFIDFESACKDIPSPESNPRSGSIGELIALNRRFQ